MSAFNFFFQLGYSSLFWIKTLTMKSVYRKLAGILNPWALCWAVSRFLIVGSFFPPQALTLDNQTSNHPTVWVMPLSPGYWWDILISEAEIRRCTWDKNTLWKVLFQHSQRGVEQGSQLACWAETDWLLLGLQSNISLKWVSITFEVWVTKPV